MNNRAYELLVEERNRLDKKIKEYELADNRIKTIDNILNKLEGKGTIDRIVIDNNSVYIDEVLETVIKENKLIFYIYHARETIIISELEADKIDFIDFDNEVIVIK